MKINKLEINNYRSCISTKLDFVENLTTLIGINGAGKSNILLALNLFATIKRTGRGFFYTEKEKIATTQINLSVNIDSKEILVRAVFYYETDEINIDRVKYSDIKFRFADSNNPRKWNRIEPHTHDIIEYLNYKEIQSLPRQFQTEIFKWSISLVSNLSNISYYSATQFSDPNKCPTSIELDDDKINTKSGINSVHQKFIYDLYKSKISSSTSTFKLFLNTVGLNGLELIENIDFQTPKIPNSSYKVRAGGQVQKIISKKQLIIPSISIDGLNLSPNQLSEGTFKTLALIFYILNDKSEILLIEEPEVCVHHGLLNSIIELIKQQSKKKQIVITTHSDYILDMLEPTNILLINKTPLNGTKAQELTKSLSKNEYEVLKNYLLTTGNLGEYWKEGGFING